MTCHVHLTESELRQGNLRCDISNVLLTRNNEDIILIFITANPKQLHTSTA